MDYQRIKEQMIKKKTEIVIPEITKVVISAEKAE